MLFALWFAALGIAGVVAFIAQMRNKPRLRPLLITFIVACVAAVPFRIWLDRFEYSAGERVGIINKFSYKGVLWKTWEGEMVLGGLRTADGVQAANLWAFSLDRVRRRGENTEQLSKALNGYMRTGTRVRITYRHKPSPWPWRADTGYLVQSVEPEALER